MDNLKNAFSKVKEDISSLRSEVNFLKQELIKTRESLISIAEVLSKLNKKIVSFEGAISENTQKTNQNQFPSNPTENPNSSTTPTHNPTDNIPFKPLNSQIKPSSTGNEGVPTDRQTDRQTDKPTQKTLKKEENTLKKASEILDSLDNLKKEIRIKFKRITDQEMVVFSTLYQLEEEQGFSNYKVISKRLGLSESSIRDYVQRLIKKGIPVEKRKINNKTINLFVSPGLKKIASLSTILQLRIT